MGPKLPWKYTLRINTQSQCTKLDARTLWRGIKYLKVQPAWVVSNPPLYIASKVYRIWSCGQMSLELMSHFLVRAASSRILSLETLDPCFWVEPMLASRHQVMQPHLVGVEWVLFTWYSIYPPSTMTIHQSMSMLPWGLSRNIPLKPPSLPSLCAPNPALSSASLLQGQEEAGLASICLKFVGVAII